MDYKDAKQSHGGDRASYQNDNLKTHQKIAKEYNVGEQTVIRAEKFVDAVDTIAQNVDEDAKDEIPAKETLNRWFYKVVLIVISGEKTDTV